MIKYIKTIIFFHVFQPFFVLRLLRSLFNPSTLALAKMSASMEPPISFVRPPRKRWKPGVVNRIGSLNYKYMNWKEFKEYHYSKLLIDDFEWIKQAWNNAEFAALFTERDGKKVECARVLIGDITSDMPPPSSRTPTERKQEWPRSSPADIPDRPAKYLRKR